MKDAPRSLPHGAPADHFPKWHKRKAITARSLKKAIRQELARRRAQRTRRF